MKVEVMIDVQADLEVKAETEDQLHVVEEMKGEVVLTEMKTMNADQRVQLENLVALIW
jgi:hypothetical protein